MLRPGTRFVNLDVTRANNPLFRTLFGVYFYRIVPLVGGIVGGSKSALPLPAAIADELPRRAGARRTLPQRRFQGRAYRAHGRRRDRDPRGHRMMERPKGVRADWEGLDLYATGRGVLPHAFSTDNVVITEAVRRMLAAGGKRLRPRSLLLAAEAVGADPRDHFGLAAYMELIHVATLIHDDVVDRADMRRGVNATAIDYGNRVSVLAGDYLFAWIFRNVTADYPAPIPHILSSMLADICDGEVLQLRALGNLKLGLPTNTSRSS